MRKTFVICLTLLLVVGVAASAFAKVDVLPRLSGVDDIVRPNLADPNLVTSSSSDTFVFGPYDFESGWQGWTKVDLTQNPTLYGHIQDLTTVSGSRGNARSGGLSSFSGLVGWIGSLGANACGSKACFPGYDNNTDQLLFKTYTISSGQHLTVKYREDSEPGYDYGWVFADRAGGGVLQGDGSYVIAGVEADRDTLNGTGWTGFTEGDLDVDLSGYAGQTIGIYFEGHADGGYSDGDCNYNSQDGMMELDNLQVGADLTTFDSGLNGWTCGIVHGVGTFAKLEALSTLPNSDPCPAYCGLAGQVVTMYDPTDPLFHPVNQDDAIRSPVIDLTINSKYPVGSYVEQFDAYGNLPIPQGNFYFWKVRYQPVEISNCSCLDPNDWSPDQDENTIYYHPTPTCVTARAFNLSAKIPGHAQRVQMSIGTFNYPYYATSPGGNQSPYFDNISLRAAAVSAPAVVNYAGDLLQDAYPNAIDFLTAKSTPAKIDCAVNIFSPGRSHTREGDSTTVSVATGCGVSVEVDYLIKVTPGPCLNVSHPWWVAYSSATKIASGPYAGFAVARADTARATSTGANASSAGSAYFMSRFNEQPIAAGTTYAGLDGAWMTYTGGAQNVSMFPDDLFTPGTHIEWVVHDTYIPKKDDNYAPSTKYGNGDGDRVGDEVGNQRWITDGGTYDPSATFCNSTMVLPATTMDQAGPSTANCNAAQPAHCFLYVDRNDQGGSQQSIEAAFRNLRISFDKYDVTNPTGAMGNDLGSRFSPGNYANGDHAPGPLPVLLNALYRAILWNTGTISGTNFTYGSTASGADAGDAVSLLDGWLRTTTDGKYLWVSGNGNSGFLNKTGTRLTFLNQTLGTTYLGIQYRDKNTAWGINLTGLGPDCTTGLSYGLRGNWCPQRYTYNYVDKYTGTGLAGVNAQNFKYPDASGTWYAGIQDVATTGGFNFRTQNDAFSLHYLRQPGVTITNEQNGNIQNWSALALSSCFTGCFPSLTSTGIGGGKSNQFENSLAGQSRPVTGNTSINFTLSAAGHAAVRVYDVSGRLVSTVFDGLAQAGLNNKTWNSAGAKSGIYFYQIESNGFKSAKKIILVN